MKKASKNTVDVIDFLVGLVFSSLHPINSSQTGSPGVAVRRVWWQRQPPCRGAAERAQRQPSCAMRKHTKTADVGMSSATSTDLVDLGRGFQGVVVIDVHHYNPLFTQVQRDVGETKHRVREEEAGGKAPVFVGRGRSITEAPTGGVLEGGGTFGWAYRTQKTQANNGAWSLEWMIDKGYILL
ncbi:hypothetical protein B296_00059186 [Ensete ventricosum]|uniref:Uncharacterized protein n=1 Tax=Ensete ventricosum TaxID=4639 RepID=A0A426XIQ8_ENSVE|nr:hypothetical protein B296_00059186 [Ensete ventricosum]